MTEDHRAKGFWPSAQRQANTVFLFFLNPVLDPQTKRLSGTRMLTWIVVWADTYDILHAHSLQELRITKAATTDALDWHNVALYGLAFLIWNGPRGMQWGVDLVKAWKGTATGATG